MSLYGYIRVSSREQNEDRQLIAMKEREVPDCNIFMDKQSGKDFQRPAYRLLLRSLNRGDLLMVQSIDRLGRSYKEIMEQWRVITREIGADICILDMPLLDTTNCKDLLGTFISDLVLQLLSFVAENERDNIRKRQEEGIAAARMRGVRFGRPRKSAPENIAEIVEQWRCGGLAVGELEMQCGISVRTIYRRLREQKQKNENIF